jgi:Na+/H+ antiporter NhaD/arsenite permease-like protein
MKKELTMRILKNILSCLPALAILMSPALAMAATVDGPAADYTAHMLGYVSIGLFVLAYALVIAEESLHLRKSKPVLVAAGILWVLVAVVFTQNGDERASSILRHNLLEFAELCLFLMAAMTYINVLDERNVFQALRAKLVSYGFSLRTLYWITGIMAFFMSPVADNLTTALVMGAVVLAVGAGNPAFIAVACINIVVAANSGGAFSPFGDITTLMVWQKGHVTFFEFFALFVPSVVSWIIPAFFMSLAVEKGVKPQPIKEKAMVKPGGFVCTALFLLTIVATIMMHNTLHLPPFLGMMSGLGFIMAYGFFIRRQEVKEFQPTKTVYEGFKPAYKPFDVFISIKRVEWDTLLFFYGIILCVGALGAFGYLAMVSDVFYTDLGPTKANIAVGILSAIIDNIPVMFAVLSMSPDMSHGQWLLVTLTAGIGGSMLSIGSAAGVALMGQARGVYTFFSHLKWTWAIALGYAASIWVHMTLNAHHF